MIFYYVKCLENLKYFVKIFKKGDITEYIIKSKSDTLSNVSHISSDKFENEFKQHIETYKYAIIRLQHISIIDASGLIMLENIIKYFQSKNVEVLLLQMPRQISKKVKKFGINDLVGKNRIFDNIEDVLQYIKA